MSMKRPLSSSIYYIDSTPWGPVCVEPQIAFMHNSNHF